ncbi:Acetyltransferase (GNAT) family protein [Deinococcus reticulitermitis]|uniref:Acetyltransferase (GNAT) family protein n=1 Tax=Deinococcus reticulitermitis TaxID=856736 RepID=A0A1H6XAI6_9DEIO|nr:GNAT family N-acetyltransferase [Deinococcus reticulitermitis]SEJ25156.1 Acetyltransferase (GNAT) family protein [Deinococcus reticulitermitis]
MSASAFSLRPTTPADQPALRALLRRVWGEHPGAAYHGNGRRPGTVAEQGGKLLGYGHCWRSALHPTFSYVGVHVHPEARGQGLGTQLWQEVTRGVPGPFKAKTDAGQVEAVRFLRDRGLRLSVTTHEPTLGLARLPSAVGEEELQEVRGFELLPLSSFGDPRTTQRVTDLHRAVYAHTHEHDPPQVEVLDEEDFLGDDLHPAWLWVARRGDRLAGVSSVRRTENPTRGELGWFGVRREFAALREPLTLALTVRALHAAAQDGVEEVSAELDSADPGALHLHRSLPWTPGSRWLTFTGRAP